MKIGLVPKLASVAGALTITSCTPHIKEKHEPTPPPPNERIERLDGSGTYTRNKPPSPKR
ncbi:MAG: hypothetical protein QNJ31_04010 [Candidatus Caenarcaniphilales bacterium]|nr:hypothetical protein [Candidatus Caenarcaniphilales bacterium]